MFSIAGIGLSHFGQRDLGFTIESPAGQREMHTFRNDPMHAPITK
jgi:hypothetical protein